MLWCADRGNQEKLRIGMSRDRCCVGYQASLGAERCSRYERGLCSDVEAHEDIVGLQVGVGAADRQTWQDPARHFQFDPLDLAILRAVENVGQRDIAQGVFLDGYLLRLDRVVETRSIDRQAPIKELRFEAKFPGFD